MSTQRCRMHIYCYGSGMVKCYAGHNEGLLTVLQLDMQVYIMHPVLFSQLGSVQSIVGRVYFYVL